MADSVRDRLERLAASDDPDVKAQARALLGIIALYENDPYKDVPANWIYAIISRHLIKDTDVILSTDTRTLIHPSTGRSVEAEPGLHRSEGGDPWGHRDHIVGEAPHLDR